MKIVKLAYSLLEQLGQGKHLTAAFMQRSGRSQMEGKRERR